MYIHTKTNNELHIYTQVQTELQPQFFISTTLATTSATYIVCAKFDGLYAEKINDHGQNRKSRKEIFFTGKLKAL